MTHRSLRGRRSERTDPFAAGSEMATHSTREVLEGEFTWAGIGNGYFAPP
jgi:hypothetical protein